MSLKKKVLKFWDFLKQDTWQSWLVSLVLVFLFIKFMFFPTLSWVTGTSLPLVVVESCSMYHESGFESWWSQNGPWYEQKNISEDTFRAFSLSSGLNKGDIVVVWGRGTLEIGDIIIFRSVYQYPLIHRIVSIDPLSTKGDHNFAQLDAEKNIDRSAVVGRGVAKIPALGWIKLIFFEGFKSREQRGFCS